MGCEKVELERLVLCQDDALCAEQRQAGMPTMRFPPERREAGEMMELEIWLA